MSASLLKYAILFVIWGEVFFATDPGTFWEEKLETEIDLRPPSSFRQNHSGVIMNVRQLGFLNMPYNHSGVISTRSIGGWDQFAHRYACRESSCRVNCALMYFIFQILV